MSQTVPYFCRGNGKHTRTKRVGVSIFSRSRWSATAGHEVVRYFFQASIKRKGKVTSRSFAIDMLGKAVAWRAAVQYREDLEREVALARRAADGPRREARRQYQRNWEHSQPKRDQAAYQKQHYAKNREARICQAREYRRRQKGGRVR